jgi:hypothetical protein
MTEYHFVLLTPDGHEAARRDFQAESDADAVIIARAFYAERATRDGLTLWQGARCVYCEDCEPERADAYPLATT